MPGHLLAVNYVLCAELLTWDLIVQYKDRIALQNPFDEQLTEEFLCAATLFVSMPFFYLEIAN